MDSTYKKSLKNKVRKRILVVLFIDNFNSRIYSEIVNTLENDYLVGRGNYPRDMATAHKIQVNYNPMAMSGGATSDRITFATGGRPRTQKEKSRITCF